MITIIFILALCTMAKGDVHDQRMDDIEQIQYLLNQKME